MKNKMLKMDDSLIADIARVLQLAMITGTDIVDHMRAMQLVAKDGKLMLDESYRSMFDEMITKLDDEATKIMEEELGKDGNGTISN